ncbi:MAG: endonuclease/exonuclease/phosphatase family protein [Bacteroidaceae bacterium]|nr:endonuclease/exonuclease/phosphatase family protein [Bacteroidaceae bacterium]
MKKIVLYILLFINVLFCIGFLIVGYSYRLNPIDHPLLSVSGLTFPFWIVAVLCWLVFWVCVWEKWMYLFVSLATLLIGYAPIHKYVPMTPNKIEADKSLTVISYNMGLLKSDSTEAEIAEYMSQTNCDILCLQEANISPKMVRELSRFMRYYKHDTPEGNSLYCFSRYPIVKEELIPYEAKTNASICYYIKYKGKVIRVINNHFECTRIGLTDRMEMRANIKGALDDESKMAALKRVYNALKQSAQRRAPQAEAVAKFVGEKPEKTIVVGDFNDTPISYTHYVFDRIMTDCYAKGGILTGHSYEFGAIKVRIDHAFCSDDFIVERCQVDRKARFSDHFPLITNLNLQ